MMNKQNMTIGVLSGTALLMVLVLVFVGRTDPAMAGNAESRGGDFVVLPLAISDTTEAVIVVDNSVERLNVYSVDKDGNLNFNPALTINVDQYFEQPQQPRVVVPAKPGR